MKKYQTWKGHFGTRVDGNNGDVLILINKLPRVVKFKGSCRFLIIFTTLQCYTWKIVPFNCFNMAFLDIKLSCYIVGILSQTVGDVMLTFLETKNLAI